MCQLRYSSTQRRPNTTNYQHKCVSCPQQQEQKWRVDSRLGSRKDGAREGELNFGVFILQLGKHFENMEQRRVVLFFCAHTAFGLSLLKSPVMTDVSQSRRMIHIATTRKQQSPTHGSLSVSDTLLHTLTHTHTIHVCMTFWAALYDCYYEVCNCSDHKEIPFKKLLFQTRSLIKECMILQWQDCIINSLQTVEFGCVTLKNVQNWRPVIKALREIPTH